MTVDLARWQFALVTIFHFFFVPVTIGLGFMVAIMQTLAYRRHDDGWDRLSRFFGRLFLINLAVGVVSGIVLEFQFGMNWSSYSVFVGNIFGAPLAIEGLLAFFLESTFIGLWIFGRGRLSPRLHLATIWIVSAGTMLSALFILAANSWMQHPVGYKVVHGQAVLTNFWAVLGNSTLWEAFAHTVLAALVTGSLLVLGISMWRAHREGSDGAHRPAFVKAAGLAAAVALVAVVLTSVAGDAQARLMDSQQPMKMASAEALYQTQNGASFSLLTIGNLSGKPVFQIRVPHVLSMIADLSWDGQVRGINQVQKAETAAYGRAATSRSSGSPTGRSGLMVGAGMLMILLAAWGVVLARRKRLLASRWFRRAALAGMALPFLANTMGWIFTEAGRQPWIVYGLMRTATGVSGVTAADVLLTLVGFPPCTRPRGRRRRPRPPRGPPPLDLDEPDQEPPATSPVSSTEEDGHGAVRRPEHHLVRPHRPAVGGLLLPRGVRLRGGGGHAVRHRRRNRPPPVPQRRRPGVGRQRGVAARGRRRHLRRLPALVRPPVQRLLPGPVPRAGGAHRAGCLVRVPGQERAPRVAPDMGRGQLRREPDPGRGLGRRLHRPRARPPPLPGPATPAASSACSPRGARRRAGQPGRLRLHGSVFLSLKTSGALSQRARNGRAPRAPPPSCSLP